MKSIAAFLLSKGSGGSSDPGYPIEETKTGQKWIDGEDIYRIVLTLTSENTSAGNVQDIDSDFDLSDKNVIGFHGIVYNNTNHQRRELTSASGSYSSVVYVTGGGKKIRWSLKPDASNYIYTAVIVLEYTKSQLILGGFIPLTDDE